MSDADRHATAAIGEPPVAHRVTPEALENYGARRPGPRLSAGSLVRGATIAWLTFPVFTMAIGWIVAPGAAEHARVVLGLILFYLVFSLVPVAVLGLPFGVLLATGMRQAENQWWHVAAFAALGLVVGGIGVLVFMGFATITMIPATALAAATGRLALWRRFQLLGAGG